MKKLILFFLLALSSSFASENNSYSGSRIFNLKGEVLYRGPVLIQGNQVKISTSLPKGVYFLQPSSGRSLKRILVGNSGMQLSSPDSSEISNQIVYLNSGSKNILRKETDNSSEYYLNTDIFVVNGVGYKAKYDAQKTFRSFFKFCRSELQEAFPEDTIYTDLIFNVTSGNLSTDVIQSILIKAEDLGLDMDAIHGWDLFSMNLPEFLEDYGLDSSESITALASFIQEKLDEVNEILETNELTEDALFDAIAHANSNKARAFVLGHSQGGMYTYKAFNSFSEEEQGHFYSFNVAVPTDKNPNWHLANDNDDIVNWARILLSSIPEGEENESDDGKDYGGESGHHHAWLDSYYNPHLSSYKKINDAVENAFATVPYWEKIYESLDYSLIWYNGAAITTIEVELNDGTFATLGTYQGYDITDSTVINVSNPKIDDGLPTLRVTSYHHNAWWGPYLSTDPDYFKIVGQDDGSYVYLMSDAWSPGSFDDAEFSITLKLKE